MKKFKDFISENKKIQIQEALTPAQERTVSKWKRGDYSFSDKAFPEGSDTVFVKLDDLDKSDTQKQIEEHLHNNGIRVSDYRNNEAVDKYNRTVSIGKALNKTKAPDELKRSFENDPVRQAKSVNSDFRVAFTRDRNHVAGITSRGHSWEEESCMNFATGIKREYLKKDLIHGSHAAYLVHKDDLDIKNPLARISLKPFSDIDDPSNKILVADPRTYGPNNEAFSKTVSTWLSNNFPVDPSKVYRKNPHLSNEGGINNIIGKDALDRVINSNDDNMIGDAIDHPDLSEKQITDILNKKKRPFSRVILHKNANDDHILHAMDSPNIYGNYIATAIDGNNVSHRVLSKGFHMFMNNPNDINSRAIVTSVAKNKNTTPEMLERIHDKVPEMNFDQDKSFMRAHIASNINAPEHLLKRIINLNDPIANQEAFKNPNLSSESITKILKDKNVPEYSKEDLFENPNITSEHIDHALNSDNDRFHNVVSRRLGLLSDDHINKLLEKNSPTVERNLLHKQDLSPDIIEKLYKKRLEPFYKSPEENPSLRSYSTSFENVISRNKNTSPDILKEIAKNSDHIHSMILIKPTLNSDHIHDIIDHAFKNDQEYKMEDIMRNPNIDNSHLKKLYENGSIHTRLSVMEHPKASQELLKSGLNDIQYGVRHTAIKRIDSKDVLKEHLKNETSDMLKTTIRKRLKEL